MMLTAFGIFVMAHERWFLPPEAIVNMPKDPFFSGWNDINLAYALSAIGVFIIAIIIHFLLRHKKRVGRICKWLEKYGVVAGSLIRTFTGISLFIGFSGLFSYFLSDPPLHVLIRVIGMFIGLAFITGIFLRTSAFIAMIFFISALFVYPVRESLQYFFLFGIAFYLFLSGDNDVPKIKAGIRFNDFSVVSYIKKIIPYGFSVLRMSVGAGIIFAALWNKIMDPRPALAFIAGPGASLQVVSDFLGMTNAQFILAAGLCELILGVLLFFGFLVRLSGFALFTMFLLGIAAFGLPELIGHLPFLAVSFAFMTLGGGEKWSFEKERK